LYSDKTEWLVSLGGGVNDLEYPESRFGVVVVLRGDVYGDVGGRSTRNREDER
jgi:hypothetical protein